MPLEQVPFMKSTNFEFLRGKRAVLADLGGFAENPLSLQRESDSIAARYAALRLPQQSQLEAKSRGKRFDSLVQRAVRGELTRATVEAGGGGSHART